jgi:hypothetical protein
MTCVPMTSNMIQCIGIERVHNQQLAKPHVSFNASSALGKIFTENFLHALTGWEVGRSAFPVKKSYLMPARMQANRQNESDSKIHKTSVTYFPVPFSAEGQGRWKILG